MRHLKPKSMLIAFTILITLFLIMFTMIGTVDYKVVKAKKEIVERVQK